MLRKTLLIFGWTIPFLTILGIGMNIYVAATVGSYRSQEEFNPFWSYINAGLTGFQSLALSPLCFFGAYMLKSKQKS